MQTFLEEKHLIASFSRITALGPVYDKLYVKTALGPVYDKLYVKTALGPAITHISR